ncbi:PEGA domain-containing protein [bacterium]|nr:PEGA domain-containing protein [bacterium]
MWAGEEMENPLLVMPWITKFRTIGEIWIMYKYSGGVMKQLINSYGKRIVIILTMLQFIGCATMFNVPTDRITFDSEPKGAQVFINDKKIGDTVIEIDLDPQIPYLVEFKKEGYENKVIQLTSSIGQKWILLDCIFLWGFVVDAVTREWYTIDQKHVFAVLDKTRVDRIPGLAQDQKGIMSDSLINRDTIDEQQHSMVNAASEVPGTPLKQKNDTTDKPAGTIKTEMDQKQIVIFYNEKKKPVPDKEIMFSYYDEIALKRVIVPLKTDERGMATVSIPGYSDGSSSIFTMALSEALILKHATGIRIPPSGIFGGGKNSMVLKRESKWYVHNEGSEMQIMSFPGDGSSVHEINHDIHIMMYDFKKGLSSGGHQMAIANGGIKPVGVGDIFMEGSSYDLTW